MLLQAATGEFKYNTEVEEWKSGAPKRYRSEYNDHTL